jgi:hypothetical protein
VNVVMKPYISVKWEFLDQLQKSDLCHKMSLVVASVCGLGTDISTVLVILCQME